MRSLSLGGPRVTGYAEMKAPPSLSVGLLARLHTPVWRCKRLGRRDYERSTSKMSSQEFNGS